MTAPLVLLLLLLLLPAPPAQAGSAPPAAGAKSPSGLYDGDGGARLIDPAAQWAMGWRYYLGEGRVQNSALAFKWWLRAAKQGYVNAECRVGMMYLKGIGTAQDYAEAWFWLSLVQKYQSGELIFPADAWYAAGQHLSEQQKNELQARVQAWKPVPERPAEP
jgi:TPR repeat protein